VQSICDNCGVAQSWCDC